MKSIQETVDAACRKLEETVLDLGVELSFNIDSIPLLEDVTLSVKQAGDPSALNGACFMVGCYLGEIIRRSSNGNWVASTDGPPVIAIAETQISPVEKVKKFANAPEDESLVFFANVLVSGAK